MLALVLCRFGSYYLSLQFKAEFGAKGFLNPYYGYRKYNSIENIFGETHDLSI